MGTYAWNEKVILPTIKVFSFFVKSLIFFRPTLSTSIKIFFLALFFEQNEGIISQPDVLQDHVQK